MILKPVLSGDNILGSYKINDMVLFPENIPNYSVLSVIGYNANAVCEFSLNSLFNYDILVDKIIAVVSPTKTISESTKLTIIFKENDQEMFRVELKFFEATKLNDVYIWDLPNIPIFNRYKLTWQVNQTISSIRAFVKPCSILGENQGTLVGS